MAPQTCPSCGEALPPELGQHALVPTAGAVYGSIMGRLTAYDVPVDLKRYYPGRGTVMIRFDRPAYEERFVQLCRAQAVDWDQPGDEDD